MTPFILSFEQMFGWLCAFEVWAGVNLLFFLFFYGVRVVLFGRKDEGPPEPRGRIELVVDENGRRTERWVGPKPY